MILTTLASLFILLRKYIEQRNVLLMVTDVLLLVLSVGVAALVVRTFFRPAPARAARVPLSEKKGSTP
jgi:hypothetical protein